MRIPPHLLAPLTALALLGTLSACAAGPGTRSGSSATLGPSSTSVSSSAAGAPSTASAVALVGTRWHVAGRAGTTVAFDGLTITVVVGAASSRYPWTAQGDQVLVGARSASLAGAVAAPWLTAATRVARDTAGWELLDAAGAPTARLTADGTVAPTTTTSLLTRAARVDGVVDEPASALSSRWIAAGDVRTAITFADGTWRATASCTTGAVGGSGQYRVLPGGHLLAIRTGTLIRGCPVVDGPVLGQGTAISAIVRAASFRIAGGTLTLYDRTGTRLGSLVHG